MLLTFWPVCILNEGYQYQSPNAYHSAISSTHQYVDSVSMGNHPTVTRLLQGVFNSRLTGHQEEPSKDFIVESLKRMTKPLLVLQFCHLTIFKQYMLIWN